MKVELNELASGLDTHHVFDDGLLVFVVFVHHGNNTTWFNSPVNDVGCFSHLFYIANGFHTSENKCFTIVWFDFRTHKNAKNLP